MSTKIKKLLFVMLVMLLAVTMLSGCGGDGGAVDEEPENGEAPAPELTSMELHLNHFMSAMHPLHTNVLEPFAADVLEATEGRINIVVHPGNALAAPGDTYDAVVSGVVDMGFVLPAYTAGRFPMAQVLEYPFLFNSALQANLTAADITPMLREHEFTDTMLLWFGGSDLGHLLMQGNADELHELRGLQLRSPGPIYNDVIEAIGAVAVTLPVSDLYDSMDRGIVTGSFMAPSALISFRLIEVTDTVIELDLYTTPFIFFMNLDRWNNIAPQDQEAIMALLDEFPEKIGRQYDEEIEHAMALAEEESLNIVRFSDEDMAAFHEAVDPLIQGWIEELEAAGKPGQELYELVLQYAEQHQ